LPCCNVTKRAAGRAIEQYPISRIAQPGAKGRKPETSGLALCTNTTELAGLFAVDKGAVEIALGAKDERVGLEIDAQRGAGEETGQVKIIAPPGSFGSTQLLVPKP
jgi:hypothetical protein